MVRPVGLRVVVLHEAVVRGDEVRPAFGLGEVVVGHAPLDVERGLDVALSRPTTLDLLLADAEGLVDGPGLLGPEDPAAVGHQRLGRDP